MTAAPVPRDLAQRTLDVLLLSATPSGHLAQRVSNEHRGNCLPPGHCTPECNRFGALVAYWDDVVKALDADTPTQLLDDAS